MPPFTGPAGWPVNPYVSYRFNISSNFNYIHRVYAGTSIDTLSLRISVSYTHVAWLTSGMEYYMWVDGYHMAADGSDPAVGTISYIVTAFPGMPSNDRATRPAMLVPGVTQFPYMPFHHNGGASADVSSLNEPLTPGGIGRTLWYR